MIRTFFLAVLLLFPAAAIADPYEQLLAAAHAGDDDGVEAILRGAESAELQRDMVWELATSHPDTVRFTEDWLAKEPDNPVALTVRAWSLHRAGFVERGGRSTQYSWSPSLRLAGQMFDDAYAMAEKAAKLDPRFLPASDAVMRMAMITGNHGRIPVEARRIMALDPNRHSLMLGASSLAPQWGGSVGAIEDICEELAEAVADAQGYTRDICLIDAVLDGFVQGPARDWAKEQLVAQIDNPLLDEHLIEFAEEGRLEPEQADRLRERLANDDRMTVWVFLSGRSGLIAMSNEAGKPEPLDFATLNTIMERDLAAAKLAADRDPGRAQALIDLSALYNVVFELRLRDIGYYVVPQPADIEPRYFEVRDERELMNGDLKERALRLLKAAPRNVEALVFAAGVLRDHKSDPLEAAEWNLKLLSNAIVYSNYQVNQLGRFVSQAQSLHRALTSEMERGAAPTYEASEIDRVLVCPYVRALRLLESGCQGYETGFHNCMTDDNAFSDPEGLYMQAEARGACKAERDAWLMSLEFEEHDLGL